MTKHKDQQDIVLSGILRVHARGFGFLQADDKKQFTQDVFIPKHLTLHAVDGDRVEVLVNTESYSEKGPEGKVIAILERSRTHLAGIISDCNEGGYYSIYSPILGKEKKIVLSPTKERELRFGDRIVMEVTSWGNKEEPTYCKYSDYIGNIDESFLDNEAAIEEFGLRSQFPDKVRKEGAACGNRVLASEIKDREDMRSIECVTIDPDTAKDFDDAVSVIPREEGGYRLIVHIADVSHYVKPGTALDLEARERCNSTYLPSECLPMLPKELSDNLCSLKPNVNRLAISVIMDFNEKGQRIHYRICRSVIRSAKRFTYKEAFAVLEGKKESPFSAHLKHMVALCKLLKKQRYERGSIEFSLPELVVLVDNMGEPLGTDYVVYDITHQMVEEFMLSANETIATHLANLGKNLTYRIHEEPTEESLQEFMDLVRSFGFEVPKKVSVGEIQKVFDEAIETKYGSFLAVNFIRRMKMASYSPENIGHYGLALTHYCHFTSPIRRYVDLLVHRVLFGYEEELGQLDQVAKKCSDQERISAKAESSVRLLKKLRLLTKMHAEDRSRSYEAVVTRVKPFGFFVEVLDLMLEGFIHISEIDDDYYLFEERAMLLRGRHRGKIYKAGETVQVSLKRIDLIYLESDWYLVQEGKKANRTERKEKQSRKDREPRRPDRNPDRKKNRRKRTG